MCSVTRREQDVRCCRNVDRQEMCAPAVNTCTPSVCSCRSCEQNVYWYRKCGRAWKCGQNVYRCCNQDTKVRQCIPCYKWWSLIGRFTVGFSIAQQAKCSHHKLSSQTCDGWISLKIGLRPGRVVVSPASPPSGPHAQGQVEIIHGWKSLSKVLEEGMLPSIFDKSSCHCVLNHTSDEDETGLQVSFKP